MEAQEQKYVLDENNDIVADERVAIPENYYALLQEAVNDLYKKVCDEGQELVESHKDHKTPTAVFRPAYEIQTKRIGQAGMLIRWFQAGFKIAEN